MTHEVDLLIEGATIVDGTGAPGRAGSVGVRAGRLVCPKDGEAVEAKRRIDATGLTVAPGFIDIHSHTDFWPGVDPFATSKAYDGVTTEISGNCGFSAFPLDPVTRERENKMLAPFGKSIDWDDFTGYRKSIEGSGTGIHRALLVGHGNLRKFVMGYDDRAPSAAELDRMQGVLGDLLDQGAIGFTTGLIYPPGCFAKTPEIVALAKVARSRNKIYASHIRGEGANLVPAIDEVLTCAMESGARTQISHLKASGPKNWHKIDGVLEKIAAVKAKGYPIMADRYPYTATNTSLDTCLRAWAYEGGNVGMLKRIADPVQRERILREMGEDYPPEHFKNVMVSSVLVQAGKKYEGRTVADIAAERSGGPYETLLAVLTECEGDVSAIFFTLNEEIMKRVLQLDYVMVASDATAQVAHEPYIEGMPHPRSYGTFCKVLGPLSRDGGLFPLETAVAKMTGMPARQLGFTDRGLVADGHHADLAIFDAGKVTDRSTFQKPHQYSTGMVHLLVNGTLVIEAGKLTGARPGKVVS